MDRGVVVVAGEDAGSSTTTAFSLATGRKMWEKPLAIPAAGVSAAGVLLLTRNDHESHEQGALAVDITTGRDRWRTGQDWTVRAADPAGAFFLVNDPSGALLKVAAATGEVAWTRPGLSGAVTVDAERAYVAGEKALVALDLSTGGTSWERAGHGPLLRPVVAGGVLYCVTKATRVQALAAATGRPLELPVRASPADHAVVDDGRLYLTDGSHLTAYAAGAVTG